MLYELDTYYTQLSMFAKAQPKAAPKPRIHSALSPTQLAVKRLLDLIVATIALILVLPVMTVVAIAIKLDSPGPVLFRQRRIGKGGKEYTLLKFRSMIRDAEKHTGPVWAQKDDRRITAVGRLMRRTRLDEIPQLINVF